MKNEYIYENGKILVLDDKLGQIEYDCHDDIDEELMTENIIEQIQKDLESLRYALGCQETIEGKKYNKKKRYLTYILNFLIPTIISGIVAVLCFGVQPLIIPLSFSMIGFSYGTIFNIDFSIGYNKVQDRINALLVQIAELNNRLYVENKKLNQLRINKKVSLKQKIDDRKFKRTNEYNLQKLSNLETLWYRIGYNIKDYYNYEQKGILRDMLHDEYTHNGEFDEVERITKKHGPVLTKKLTPPKNVKNK